MIKIALFSTSGLISRQGISTVLYDYFSRIDKKRFLVDYFVDGSYSNELVNQYINGGIGIKYLPSRKKKTISYLIQLYKFLKSNKYDVFYINGSSSIMCLDLLVARLAGCKTRIVHSHNTTCDHLIIDRLLRPIFYVSYTNAFACGSAAGEWLYRNRPYELIHNGRSISLYRFDENRRTKMRTINGLDIETIVIGHVGCFCPQKNQRFIVDIIDCLRDKNVKLYFIGDGEDKNDVYNYAVEKGLADKISFTGLINNVNDYLQMMDVMLLPSLYEGLPLVVVEWQISGLPCLISDNITKECECSNLISYLSINDSPDKWAEKLMEIAYQNRNSRNDSNAECCLSVSRNGFDIEENVIQLEKLLDKYVNH